MNGILIVRTYSSDFDGSKLTLPLASWVLCVLIMARKMYWRSLIGREQALGSGHPCIRFPADTPRLLIAVSGEHESCTVETHPASASSNCNCQDHISFNSKQLYSSGRMVMLDSESVSKFLSPFEASRLMPEGPPPLSHNNHGRANLVAALVPVGLSLGA